MMSVQKDERVPLSSKYTDEDLQDALKKLTDAAVKFDKERGGSMESFEASHLDLVQFKRGLKRTFNLTFTATEMGALLEFLGVGEDKMVRRADLIVVFARIILLNTGSDDLMHVVGVGQLPSLLDDIYYSWGSRTSSIPNRTTPTSARIRSTSQGRARAQNSRKSQQISL